MEVFKHACPGYEGLLTTKQDEKTTFPSADNSIFGLLVNSDAIIALESEVLCTAREQDPPCFEPTS